MPRASSSAPWALAVVVILACWWATTTGLVSSNDGSHLALARALVLRRETTIDPEVGLTLWVDRSRRDGHQYSDRPPGTAFAALPAVWLGDALDRPLLERSLQTRAVVVTPAAPRYAETYAARAQRWRGPSVPLLALQGTALLLGLQAMAMGGLGLWAVDALLRRREVGIAGRLFAAIALGLATLWGPYATVLFSHVTAGAMAAVGVLALERSLGASTRRGEIAWGLLAGLTGAWAAAADYLVALLVAGLYVATAWRAVRTTRTPRTARAAGWGLAWLAIGALPVVVATAAYHHAAFGSITAIGYDHHANFEFARDRAATFDGNPLRGLWTLWGLGEGAGALALAPVTLVGIAGLWRSPDRAWLWGATPWVLALALHHTPAGGASEDHRYLVPILPFGAIGLGHLWSRVRAHPRARPLGAGLLAVAAVSAALVWSHFFAGRG